MESEWLGEWVIVTYSYGGIPVYGGGANYSMAFGVLESVDEGALLVRQANGETLYLPAETVREIRPMPPPESGPKHTLLRSSDGPETESDLLRPAESAAVDSVLLLRPDSLQDPD